MICREILVLAMTKMLTGICTAGFSRESDPVTGLQWVRPVRDFCTVQPGDMTDSEGRLIQCFDVVELNLVERRPDPPHVEDWLVDFVHHRPRVLRRLEGERREAFFPRYLDRAPEDVLIHHSRSLCLVRPKQVWAVFSRDAYSGKYQSRMGFLLDGDLNHPRAAGRHGVSVTDLKWRDLGMLWLRGERGTLRLGHEELMARLDAEALYLAVGLSRSWRGEFWPLVVGVHVVPDYELPH